MAKNTWKKIKEDLSNQLPGHTISTWFDPINPVAIDGNDLILEVPSQFFYDWIESHYRHHINKSIEVLNLNSVSTKFIISAETQEIKTDEKQDLTPVKKSPLIPIESPFSPLRAAIAVS